LFELLVQTMDSRFRGNDKMGVSTSRLGKALFDQPIPTMLMLHPSHMGTQGPQPQRIPHIPPLQKPPSYK
jgi:hypothetical protein